MKHARIALVVVLGLSQAPAFGQKLSKSHKQWLEKDVSALVTRDEARLFRSLSTDQDRDTFQGIFWLRRDPNLRTPENEFQLDFEERIRIADDRIGTRRGRGSLSDMGQIFLLLGFPSGGSTGSAAPGLPTASRNPSAVAGGSTSEVAVPTGGGTSRARTQTWSYPSEDLEVRFRARQGFGYVLVKTEELDAALESRRQSLVAHPDITYDVNEAGNLLPPAIPTDATRATELLEELLETQSTSDALTFRVTPAFFRSVEGQTYAPVLFELEADALTATDSAEYDVTFFGALEDADGHIAQRFEERVWLRAGEPARFEIPLQLAPGDYVAHFGVLDETGGTHGSRVDSIQIPAYDNGDPTFSSVVLYRSVEETQEAAGTPGRAFQFGKLKYDPVGTGSYTKAEALGLFYYVYGLDGSEVTARYVFYLDGKAKAQTNPKVLLARNGIALGSDEIPLASFQPGDYRVLIQVEDKDSGKVVESKVRFTLEP